MPKNKQCQLFIYLTIQWHQKICILIILLSLISSNIHLRMKNEICPKKSGLVHHHTEKTGMSTNMKIVTSKKKCIHTYIVLGTMQKKKKKEPQSYLCKCHPKWNLFYFFSWSTKSNNIKHNCTCLQLLNVNAENIIMEKKYSIFKRLYAP